MSYYDLKINGKTFEQYMCRERVSKRINENWNSNMEVDITVRENNIINTKFIEELIEKFDIKFKVEIKNYFAYIKECGDEVNMAQTSFLLYFIRYSKINSYDILLKFFNCTLGNGHTHNNSYFIIFPFTLYEAGYEFSPVGKYGYYGVIDGVETDFLDQLTRKKKLIKSTYKLLRELTEDDNMFFWDTNLKSLMEKNNVSI